MDAGSRGFNTGTIGSAALEQSSTSWKKLFQGNRQPKEGKG